MRTGAALLAALPKDRVIPLDVTITRSGEWLHEGRRHMPERLLKHVDGVIIGLHGVYGEDGKVQRLLERYGVPFTGSGAYASAIAMHKAITKDHLREHPVRMAPHMLVSRTSAQNMYEIAEGIASLFGPSYVVKPVRGGSSQGVLIAASSVELPRVLERALMESQQVIVEKRITGVEASCAVIEDFRDEALYTLPPIEIVPAAGRDFFDHEAKYDGMSQEICPGRFSEDIKHQLMAQARLVHTALGLDQFSRSDFIVADDGVYFLEVNTLPGMTETSLMPQALRAVGSSTEAFVDHLVSRLVA